MTFWMFLEYVRPYPIVGLWVYVLISVVECSLHRTIRQVIDLDKRWHLAILEVVGHIILAALIWPLIGGVWLNEKYRQMVGKDDIDRRGLHHSLPRSERRRQGRAAAKARALGFRGEERGGRP